jgi:hypothetical protein
MIFSSLGTEICSLFISSAAVAAGVGRSVGSGVLVGGGEVDVIVEVGAGDWVVPAISA